MDLIAAFISDAEHARASIEPLMARQAPPTRWLMVLCQPPLGRRITRFVAPASRRVWRREWAARLQSDLEGSLGSQAPESVEFHYVVADAPLPDLIQRLKLEHGAGLRLLDTRPTPLGEHRAPLLPGMPVRPQHRLAAPLAVTSTLSALLALAD